MKVTFTGAAFILVALREIQAYHVPGNPGFVRQMSHRKISKRSNVMIPVPRVILASTPAAASQVDEPLEPSNTSKYSSGEDAPLFATAARSESDPIVQEPVESMPEEVLEYANPVNLDVESPSPRDLDPFVERWEEMGGNFVLRPPGENPKVRAVIHFLGGAFVGAAPHLTYRYLLYGLAEAGFLVVATPYELSFDYLDVCDKILEKFERVAVPLAEQFGAVPVIGMGHSCGALLQVYVTCLFPSTPRAANVLISFNNKPVQDAVPAFDEVVVPIANQVMGNSSEAQRLRSAVENLFQLTDEGLANIATSVPAPPTDADLGNDPRAVSQFLLSNLRQSLKVWNQVPGLLDKIKDGTTEFSPAPDDTRESCRRMYRARRTLLIKFEDDLLDESEELEVTLNEAKDIMRLKRPMIKFDVRLVKFGGTHVTPLTQDIFLPIPQFTDFGVVNDPLQLGSPVRTTARTNFLKTVDEVKEVLLEWLGEGLKPKKP